VVGGHSRITNVGGEWVAFAQIVTSILASSDALQIASREEERRMTVCFDTLNTVLSE
jgi:hypothetical protein